MYSYRIVSKDFELIFKSGMLSFEEASKAFKGYNPTHFKLQKKCITSPSYNTSSY